jgi:protein-disulfide isomerase
MPPLRLIFAASLLIAPAAVQAAPAKQAPKTAPKQTASATANPWLAKIATTAKGGHIVGNPAAAQKIVEYMSYTCSHCAHFETESALPLRAGPISAGTTSFEVRHLLRDSLDVTAAMITNCVPPTRFFPLHHRFLETQDKWFAKAQKVTQEQMKRWNTGPMPMRMRAIAGDLDFYSYAASAGLTRAQTDGCFANESILARIIAQTKEAGTLGVDSTPSFLLGDQVLPDHDWASLQTRLSAK